jgi:hypothetical protein
MAQIEPKYITFEQAKSLKEIGFNELCTSCFHSFLEEGEGTKTPLIRKFTQRKFQNSTITDHIARPEQWQVVEWLRVNHGIWVFVAREPETGVYYPNIDVNKGDKYFDKFDDYDSPQEAYSAAFDYIFNNKFGIILNSLIFGI